MSVKRYSVGVDGIDPNGNLVKYEDYAALEQRLIESERYGRQTDITIDNLEMKLAQMAAENAGLKAEVPMGAIVNGRAFADRLEAYPFECQGGNLNMCSDWQELIRCFEHLSEWAMRGQPETPATDAFLAEVRAQGVDSAINTIILMMNHQHHVTSKAIDILRVHAYQIRKGVQL